MPRMEVLRLRLKFLRLDEIAFRVEELTQLETSMSGKILADPSEDNYKKLHREFRSKASEISELLGKAHE